MSEHLRGWAKALRGRRVVVLGDIIADEYLFGSTHRISREAPVLILKHRNRELRLGGGGNAANNIRDLGGEVQIIGILGEDAPGEEILELSRSRGIDTTGVLQLPDVDTTVKTRVLAGQSNTTMQQVIRIDREWEGKLSSKVTAHLIDRLNEMAKEADAVLISDYGLGVVHTKVVEAVNALARDRAARDGGLPVVVDSRFGLRGFRGITAATPNEAEMREVIGQVGKEYLEDETLYREVAAVRKRQEFGGLLLTRGKNGMVLFEGENPPQSLRVFGGDDVADVTGAGDTVIGIFSLSLAAGAGMWESAQLANIAGGLVVMKRGTATVTRRELLEVL